jgi:hypothetical protein
LFLGGRLDVEVNEFLTIDDRDAEFLGLRRIEKHAFHVCSHARAGRHDKSRRLGRRANGFAGAVASVWDDGLGQRVDDLSDATLPKAMATRFKPVWCAKNVLRQSSIAASGERHTRAMQKSGIAGAVENAGGRSFFPMPGRGSRKSHRVTRCRQRHRSTPRRSFVSPGTPSADGKARALYWK